MVVVFRRIDEAQRIRIAAETVAEPLRRGAEKLYARQSGGDFRGFRSGGDQFFQFLRLCRAVDLNIFADFGIHPVRSRNIDGDGAARGTNRLSDRVIDFRHNDSVEISFRRAGYKDACLNRSEPDPQKSFHHILPLVMKFSERFVSGYYNLQKGVCKLTPEHFSLKADIFICIFPGNGLFFTGLQKDFRG